MGRHSEQHDPRQDELKQELREMERANRARLEEWPEPPATASDGTGSRGDRAGGVQPQTVADVMTRELITFPVETPVTDAAQAMRDNDVGGVLVVAGGVLQGIVTDRDVVVRVLADGLDPAVATVGEICSADIVTVNEAAPVDEAVQLMRAEAVRRIPVVDDQGRPEGMVSLGDLALARQPRSALADISAAPPNL